MFRIIVLLLLVSEVLMAVSIKYNQLGYYTNGKKCAIITADTVLVNESFSVMSDTTVLYKGVLDTIGFYDKTNMFCYVADFSSVQAKGAFTILIDSVASGSFMISDSIYDDAFNKTLKSFYFQRCSMSLDSMYAGEFARSAGHIDSALVFDSVDGKDSVTLDGSGGWYDAGDYGKYVVNAGITVWTVLNMYEMFPLSTEDGSLNIPEKGDGLPDVLSEVKYELDWMLKMQDKDGGVFFKVGPNQWPGDIMPEYDTGERFVIGKSTSSTLSFAYSMAIASRNYAGYDSAYATQCIIAAEKAYAWAVENSSIEYPSNTNGSGPYKDGALDDEFFLSTVELAKTTGKSMYVDRIADYLSYKKVGDGAWWQDVTNLAFYALIQPSEFIDETITAQASQAVVDQAVSLYKRMMVNPYHIPLEIFNWGSNGAIANNAILLSYAYILTQEQPFLDAVIESTDYIFGKNGFGISMVTGVGTHSVMHPHHRISTADNVDAPVPGLVTGGANETFAGGDAELSSLHNGKTPGALCYTDVRGSWASNEPAINQNAPVVFVLGFLQSYMDPAWQAKYEQ